MNTEQIFYKYYFTGFEKFNFDFFKKITKHDPTTIIINNKLKKIGIYTKWIINRKYNFIYKNFNKDYNYENELLTAYEDLERINIYLQLFHKHKLPIEKRDINKYKSHTDLYLEIKIFYILDKNSNENIFELIQEEIDYKYLGNFNNYNCYIPLTQKGASILGCDTEWCTSYGIYSLNPNHKKLTSQYNIYNKDNLYILINKNKTSNKYQLYFPNKMFMDKNDIRIKSVDKFYQLINFLIKNDSLNQKITSLTENKKYKEMYLFELKNKLNNIHNLSQYVNIYTKYSILDVEVLSDEFFMGLISKSNFNEIYINIINNKLISINLICLLFNYFTKQHANSITTEHRKMIFSINSNIINYTFAKFLNRNNIEVFEGLGIINKGFRGISLNKFI